MAGTPEHFDASSSARASADRSPLTGWPRPDRACSCSSAARHTPRARSRAARTGPAKLLGPDAGLTGMYHYWSFKGHRRAGLGRPRRRLADLRQCASSARTRSGSCTRTSATAARVLAGQPRGPRPALRPRREDDRAAALSVRPRAVLGDAEDDRLQGGGRGQRTWSGSARSWPSRSATRAAPPVPGEAIEEELKNLHGRTRRPASSCGECDVGCNYGAKNTLDYNYLTARQARTARRSARCDVREFEPRDGGG